MTLRAALIASRKRRLRPEGYGRVASGIVAFFIMVVVLRVGANFYLLQMLSASTAAAGNGSATAAFAAQVNLSWCCLFLGSVSPILLYRGIVRTIRSERLRFAPISPRNRRETLFAASLQSVPAAAPIAVGLAALVFGAALGGPINPLSAVVSLVAGFASFAAVLGTLWLVDASEDHLELIELGLVIAIALANPDFRLSQGNPELILFEHIHVGLAQIDLAAAMPFAGGVLAAGAGFVSSIFGRARRGDVGRRRDPALVFYRAKVPLGLIAVSYAIEIPVILVNPIVKTVTNVAVAVFVLHVLWFLSFLFRSEQKIEEVVHAPQRLSARFALYSRAALFHASIAAIPIAVLIVRVYRT